MNQLPVVTKNLISYKIPLEDYNKAFELAATPGNYRVSLVMWNKAKDN